MTIQVQIKFKLISPFRIRPASCFYNNRAAPGRLALDRYCFWAAVGLATRPDVACETVLHVDRPVSGASLRETFLSVCSRHKPYLLL